MTISALLLGNAMVILRSCYFLSEAVVCVVRILNEVFFLREDKMITKSLAAFQYSSSEMKTTFQLSLKHAC